ncbi:MAG: alpha/beta fold hydrolase [Bauldia sp.]
MLTLTHRLPDGRDLAVLDCGPTDGRVVLFFHGLGTSRLCIPPSEEICRELGVRLLALDRPGTGGSSPGEYARMIDWTKDVYHLASTWSLHRFAVLGWSTGGAYALAMGAQPDPRLAGIGIVSSTAPSVGPDRHPFRRWFLRAGFEIVRRLPVAATPAAGIVATAVKRRPGDVLAWALAPMGEADQRKLDVPEFRHALEKALAEGFRQGGKGLENDVRMLARPWGFALADIHVPVLAFQGMDDKVIDPATARFLAGRLRDCRLAEYPGEGHLLYLSKWSEILSRVADLVEVRQRRGVSAGG